jgi:type III secretory pathway component EscU
MAKNKTTMSKSSDLLKLLKSSLKLQVQMICNLVHIMCVASSIQILHFVMIGQRTPLVTLASDWLKVSANSSPL